MILRKPYAFFIKHFKMIHCILTILFVYILYKTNCVLSFFNEYLDLRTYEVIDGLSSLYFPWYLYLSIGIVLLFSMIIFLLMRAKDKPFNYYVITMIYYIALIFGFLFVSNELQNIAFNHIDVLRLKITRDLLLLLFLGQFPFMLISLTRGVGFNIKKFNFQRDLMEFDIKDRDSEEFELDIDIDSHDVKTRFRRRGRIIRYVFKENKVMILAILGIALIVSGSLIYNIKYVKNKVYSEQEVFYYNDIAMQIVDSYQLNQDSFGNDITDNQYSYTLVRVKIVNPTDNDKTIKLEKFRLRISENISYAPVYNMYERFLVFGTGSEQITVTSQSENIFIIVFRVDQKYEDNKKQLEYTKQYKEIDGELIYDLTKIAINPLKIEDQTIISQANIGEELTFHGSVLNESSIVIHEIEIEDKFAYHYQQCMVDTCYTFMDYIMPSVNTSYYMTVMRLDIDIEIDEKLYNSKLKEELISNLGHIRYVINGKEYSQNIPMANITPNTIHDYFYYEVKGEIKNASSIYLDIVVLDKVYTYTLKEV